jgi:hypothetical protein
MFDEREYARRYRAIERKQFKQLKEMWKKVFQANKDIIGPALGKAGKMDELDIIMKTEAVMNERVGKIQTKP